MNFNQFLRNWSLPLAMTGGAAMYLIYRALPLAEGTGVDRKSVV